MWIDCQIESRDMRGAKRRLCENCPGARCLNRLLDPKYKALACGIASSAGMTFVIVDADELKELGLSESLWTHPVRRRKTSWISRSRGTLPSLASPRPRFRFA